MFLRKIIIASAVVLVLAGTSPALAEKTSAGDQLPGEAMPVIDKTPNGFYVGAPMISNMIVMIVQVYNEQGRPVLNVRSKGEPVELMATDLADGKYNYQVKTLFKLDMPSGQGADYTEDGFSRSSGRFIINNNFLIDESQHDSQLMPLLQEDTSLLDKALNQAAFFAGTALESFIPAARASDLYAISTSPTITFDDTDSGGVAWRVYGSGGLNDYRIVDQLGVNVNTVIEINGLDGQILNRAAMVVDNDGDIHWSGNIFNLDKGAGTLSLGWINNNSDFSISASAPEIRLHDETDSSEAEWELTSGWVNFWGRPTNVATWNNIFNYHVNAPSNSLKIGQTGRVNFAAGNTRINGSTGKIRVGNTSLIGTAIDSLTLDDTSPEIVFLNSGISGMEIAGYNGLEVHMDTDGDGSADINNVFAIDLNAPSNSLSVAANGNLGVGTGAPTEAIDLLRVDAGARMKLTAITSTANEAPQMVWRRAQSNAGVDDAVLLNDNLGAFSFRGHDGNGFTGSRGFINVAATENWAPGANGTSMIFQVTPNGSATLAEVFRVSAGELRVTGNVVVNGTTLNVPDYVFEEDYELMSLEQLSAYIEENKHLPGVASAKEVNSTGLDLAGSQLSLLEKVEELTLYTLQQHTELKQLAEIKAENAQLKSAHQQLLGAYHSLHEQVASQQENGERLELLVNQLIQSSDAQGVYTSLK